MLHYKLLFSFGKNIGDNSNFFTWGFNHFGVARMGELEEASSPVQISGIGTDWKQLTFADNNIFIGLKNNGEMWGWGYNISGELGSLYLGELISSPVQIGTASNWSFLTGSSGHYNMAINNTGGLYGWGTNTSGELGLGDRIYRDTPTRIAGTSTFLGVASSSHTIAVKTNGTLWAWGTGSYGCQGYGDLTSRSSPIQIGALTNWSSKIECGSFYTVAIKTDGTLWSWGYNNYGQLGLRNIVNTYSPKQIGTLNTWNKISCGGAHTAAIKTDGTLWSWGLNDYGQLGIGSITHRSSPTQVGTDTNWSTISLGSGSTLARKTDGSLWSWGFNLNGRLGLGDTIHRSSPTQIGTLTHWKDNVCKIGGVGVWMIE